MNTFHGELLQQKARAVVERGEELDEFMHKVRRGQRLNRAGIIVLGFAFAIAHWHAIVSMI